MVQFRQLRTVPHGPNLGVRIGRTQWWKDRNENDWMTKFRKSKTTFDFLCNELHPYLHREDTRFRQAISENM